MRLNAWEARVDVYTMLSGAEKDDAIRSAKGEVTFYSFDSMISAGKADKVEAQLKSGDYNEFLTPQQTSQLMKRVNAAMASGTVGVNNQRIAQYENNIDRAITQANVPGQPLAPEDIAAARETAGLLLGEYEAAGKEVPKSAYKLVSNLNRTLWESEIRNAVVLDPNMDTAYALSLYQGDENVTQREARQIVEKAAIVDRPAALATDAVRIAMNAGLDVQPLADPPGSEGYFDWLSGRVNGLLPEMRARFGTSDLAGPLSGLEVSAINSHLSQLQGRAAGNGDNAFFAEIGNMAAAVNNPSGLKQLFDQLMGDDEAGLIPVAAEMASRGFTRAAEQMMLGQQGLDSGDIRIRPTANTELDDELWDILGNAYQEYTVGAPGEERQSYNLVKDGIKALYAFKLNANRGDADTGGVDATLLKEAVAEVTGGVMERHDQTFVMPNATTTPRQLNEWMVSQDGTTLPEFYDGTGSRIPADQITAGWDDRFIFESSGRPGMYYVKDVNWGTYLLDKNKARATVSYNPNSRLQPAALAGTRRRNQRGQ
jgi:hypothetical protein